MIRFLFAIYVVIPFPTCPFFYIVFSGMPGELDVVWMNLYESIWRRFRVFFFLLDGQLAWIFG